MGRILMATVLFALLGTPGAFDAELEEPENAADSCPTTPHGSIAVLDVAMVLRECDFFKQRMGALQAEIAVEGRRMKRKADEMTRDMDPDDPLPADSPKREAWEEFRCEASRLRQSFLRRERNLYRTVYDKLQNQAKAYCQELGLMGPIDLGTLRQGATMPEVVDSLDISQETLRRLNAHFAKQQSANEPSVVKDAKTTNSIHPASGHAVAGGGDDGSTTPQCRRECTEERRR